MLEQLKKNYFFAVIRAESADEAYEIAEASIIGGIKNIEITYTTPNATKAIERLVSKYSEDKEVIIGAGTVMDQRTADEALKAGAQFIVSPHYSEEVMDTIKASECCYLPGCATVTEIVHALNEGAGIIKLFPGGLLGPNFIKDIHGPLPGIDLMPSGGVSLNNVKEWKAAGAVAVGIGSALTKNFSKEGSQSVIKVAQSFIQAVEE